MKVKCVFCNITDTEKSEMIVHEHIAEGGNVYKKNFHKDCYPKFLEGQQFKDKELDELDKLVEIMMDIHKIETVPTQFYVFIQDLRNGTILIGRRKKKFKQGYPYSLIAKTYESCRESIEYWKKNKNFESTMSELKYCWAIINDKINVVKKREEKKAFQDKRVKVFENNYVKEHKDKEDVNKSKTQKKDELDISDFL